MIDKNIITNELIIGHEDDPKLRTTTISVTNRHRSHTPYPSPFTAEAKLRYRQADQPCTVHMHKEGKAVLQFEHPQRAATPGQIAVVYLSTLLIGQ